MSTYAEEAAADWAAAQAEAKSTTLYGMLDRRARAWWHNRNLRAQGQTVEARRRERASMRDMVRTLRAAHETDGAHVHVGRGGATFYYSRDAHVSRFAPRDIMALAMRCGISILDTRTVKNPLLLVSLPMVAVGRPASTLPDVPAYMLGPGGLSGTFGAVSRLHNAAPRGGWRALDYAPLADVARIMAGLGARVAGVNGNGG